MKISTKGRYGVRIMLDIAQNTGGSPVRIADISARQGISVKYAEQITGLLVRGGLLRSVRGAQGGYVLTKEPREYTAAEILRAAEGDFTPVECVSDAARCGRSASCATRGLWCGLYAAVSEYLSGVTLRDIIDGKR